MRKASSDDQGAGSGGDSGSVSPTTAAIEVASGSGSNNAPGAAAATASASPPASFAPVEPVAAAAAAGVFWIRQCKSLGPSHFNSSYPHNPGTGADEATRSALESMRIALATALEDNARLATQVATLQAQLYRVSKEGGAAVGQLVEGAEGTEPASSPVDCEFAEPW